MADIKFLSAASTPSGAQGLGPAGSNVNAEDVLDLIVDISPHETALVSLLPKVKASSTTHEWITDFLPAASAQHGISEGADFSLTIGTGTADTDTDNRTRNKNFLQHFRYAVKVTNLQRVMNPFGVADEYSYQVGRASKLLGASLEKCILKDQVVDNTASIQGTATDPARMKGLMQLICEENTNALGNGTVENAFVTTTMAQVVIDTLVADAATITALGTQAALTEQKITKAMDVILSKDTSGGGVPDTLIVSPSVFGHIGAFGGSAQAGSGMPAYAAQTFNTDPALRRIIRAVRFYESQYGVLQVVMSRFCPQATNAVGATAFNRASNNGMAYLVERNRLRIAFGRPFQHVPLPPAGDSTRGMVLGDVTLELLDARSAGAFAGVNNVAS